jgi:hypothetical protein
VAAELSRWALCLGAADPVDDLLRMLPMRSDWPVGLVLGQALPDGAGLPDHAAGRVVDVPPTLPLVTLLIEPASPHWRAELDRRSWPYAILQSDQGSLLDLAAAVILHAWARAAQSEEARGAPRWRWVCADCDDGDCERHWLAGARSETDAESG